MMSSSGSWSMIARATVRPPTPESKMPTGASGSFICSCTQTRLGGTLLRFPCLAFRAGQKVRRHHTCKGPAEVALPGHPRVTGQHSEQHTAVDEQHDDADHDLPHISG